MPRFLVNYNIYGTVEITATDKERARELAEKITKDEWMEKLSDEIDSGSLEIGTIDKL